MAVTQVLAALQAVAVFADFVNSCNRTNALLGVKTTMRKNE